MAFAAWTGSTPATQPAVPALGGHVTWATPWLVTLGGQPGVGHTIRLDTDSIMPKPFEDSVEDNAPLDQHALGEELFGNGISEVAFSTYSSFKAARLLSSTAVDTSGVVEEGLVWVYKSMAIEVTGLAVFYYPKVRVRLVKEGGTVKKPYGLSFVAKVFAAAAIPSGEKRISFS
jgi:hypothetical protein